MKWQIEYSIDANSYQYYKNDIIHAPKCISYILNYRNLKWKKYFSKKKNPSLTLMNV